MCQRLIPDRYHEGSIYVSQINRATLALLAVAGLGIGYVLAEDPVLKPIMEKVNDANKVLVKANRANKAAFEANLKDTGDAAQALVDLTKQIEAHGSKVAGPMKPLKVWQDSVAGVRAGSQEMVGAIKAKDQAAFKAAYRRTDDMCAKCHAVFKPDE